MFMYKENGEQKERLKKLYKKIELFYGSVPAQMKFLGNIEADYLEDFIKTIQRIAKHPNINPKFFGFIRLHISFRESYGYCMQFNTHLLLSQGYTQMQLDSAIKNIETIPFDDKHKALSKYAVKVIYESRLCTQDDLDRLYLMGWSQKDVFDAVEHAGTLFRNGRILTAYSKKEKTV